MKRISLLLGALFLGTICFVSHSHAAGTTDLLDLCTGANQSNCPFKIDANGNIASVGGGGSAVSSFTGSVSVSGISRSALNVFPPASLTLSSSTAVNPLFTYEQLLSTGATIVLGGANCSNVAITTTTALNGQFLILSSTSSTSYIQISTGTPCGVVGPTATITLLNRAVSFIFDQPAGVWKQLQQ